MFQSYVGDVRAPHLIHMVDGDAAKQIRKHEVVLARKAQVGLRIDGVNVHLLHERANLASAYHQAIATFERTLETALANSGILRVDFIHAAHDQQFPGIVLWLAVEFAPVYAEQFALPSHGQILVFLVHGPF